MKRRFRATSTKAGQLHNCRIGCRGTSEHRHSQGLSPGGTRVSDWKTLDSANPTEEHSMLREMVRGWVASEVEPQALEHDRNEKFNLGLFRQMGEMGLLGITAPVEHGGAGMDALAAALVNEEISYSDPGFCLAYLAHSMLFVNNLSRNGSEEQKARILPKVCSGEWVGAMAMSEPDIGTDVLGMSTTADRQEDGSWLINGRKMWITNGCIDDEGTPCDVVWTYAKTGVDQKGRAEISTFIVEKDHPGFSVGQKILDKTGMRASNTAELVYDDCRVPADALVGNPGESIIHMMRNLELERLTLAAQSVGIAHRCVVEMNRYATEREAFGRQIREFGQIQRH
ncbi:MAG TPA: isovaleryl-CoA dehydrogenase, partial [Planctomycetes bacterium]|nr:isovaleryl-CoA dehydrogenase [Planctomycetota bacterium]